MSKINVRFAPSPTGYLHIGGARTAIVNYLFAKKNNGKFFVRIEDTDIGRSEKKYTDSILDSLKWLNIKYDGECIIQSKQLSRHKEVINKLINDGMAYYCDCTQETINKKRIYCEENKIPYRYDRTCANKKIESKNDNIVIRINTTKTLEGNNITINDLIKEKVSVNHTDIDDFIIIRSDNTPIYLLSVVVDDHDMDITHIIRGDDHLTNTFRQYIIYKARGFKIPQFAHIPLIFGDDGKKLSKRHGAVCVTDFKEQGYLPESIINYLSLLGMPNNKIIISEQEVIKILKLDKISKSPSQFDYNILNKINNHYIKKTDNMILYNLLGYNITSILLLLNGINEMNTRAKNFN